jgi:hypothetical protein
MRLRIVELEIAIDITAELGAMLTIAPLLRGMRCCPPLSALGPLASRRPCLKRNTRMFAAGDLRPAREYRDSSGGIEHLQRNQISFFVIVENYARRPSSVPV